MNTSNQNQKSMKEIINHLKEKGFIFQGSEIYSGLANSWDYGPLGVALKNNIKREWWKFFIENNEYNVGLDSSIILNSKVWKTSGHLNNFSDPLIDCKECKSRFRVDTLINYYHKTITLDGWNNKKLEKYIVDNHIKCLKCKSENWTNIRQFQLMFETHQGVLKEEKNLIYLRPETAQGIFINFNNVKSSCNKKIPFGIGQIGKSFRNEITPGNFIFRTREFEQMELEFFFVPKNEQDNEWFDYWVKQCVLFLSNLGLQKNKNIHLKIHNQAELAHYAQATTDIEYNFPFGMSELCGICNRGNYDLTQHGQATKTKFEVQDPNVIIKKLVIPSVIEPSMGVERLLLALICEAYEKETINNKERIVLKFNKNIAPYQVAVTSLHKNKLAAKTHEIYQLLKKTQIRVTLEESSSIGKSYSHQDAIGTLYCLTIDFETSTDGMITIRERDTTKQTRILVSSLQTYLYEKLELI